jgi:ribosome-associated heat shock protein Hsp15
LSNELSAARLDIWLWAARFFKTRQLAKQAIEGGRVELNQAATKAAKQVRVGDRLLITREQEKFEIEVLGLSGRRGTATQAQALYSESEAGRARREAEREKRRMESAGMQPPAGKPDKRARRLIRALGDIDAM